MRLNSAVRRILVVDDEVNLRAAVARLFRGRQYEVIECGSGEDAVDKYTQAPFDVVILDLILPGISGLDSLTRLRQIDPNITAVMLTAHGSVPSAVEAMRAGARDYLTKPFDNGDLVLKVERALEHRQLTRRVAELESDVVARTEFSEIIGRSPSISHALRRLARVAKSDATVMFFGETGTGKDLAARSLHRSSLRSAKPFVAVNCGALPSSLAEAELFGHLRGSFTDAKSDRIGRFQEASGGTLFLDEIGELSPEVQVKLLRAIQEQEIHPIGSARAIRVDVRIITATNRDLEHEVALGRFRSDLFWRLNVFQIEMPPLRKRPEDLTLLISHLLPRVNAECRTLITSTSSDVNALFEGYGWPGNIRELANVLRHGALMADTDTIELENLPEYLLSEGESPSKVTSNETTLQSALAEAEERLVLATLARFKGNKSAAAAALGIDRRTIFAKLKNYKDRNPGV